MKDQRPSRSIRFRIGITVGAFSTVLALLLSILLGELSRRDVERDITTQLSQFSAQLAQQFDVGVEERFRELELVARRPLIRSAKSDTPTLQSVLESVDPEGERLAWIGLSDTSGQIIAEKGKRVSTGDFAASPLFLEGKRAPFIREVIVPNPQAAAEPIVEFSAPVLDSEGQLLRVVAARLNWKWMVELKEDLIRHLRQRLKLQLMLLNRDGVVLLAPANTNLEGKPAPAHFTDSADGVDRDGFLRGTAKSEGFGHFPGLGWSVITREPTSVAFEPVRRLEMRIVLVGVISGVLFGIVGWFVARLLTGPIVKIAGAARELVESNSGGRLPEMSGDDELQTLTEALNELIATRERQAEELRLNDERFRTALAHSRIVVFNQDRQLRYTWLNRDVPPLHASAMIGHTDAELLGEDAAKELTEFKRSVLESGQPAQRTITVSALDLQQSWSITVMPQRNSKGEILGIICSAVDVTDQLAREKALRTALVQFSETFENAAVGIAQMSLEGRWRRVNDKFCEIVGYTRQELLTRTFHSITHPDDLDADLGFVNRLLIGELHTYSLEKRYLHKRGHIVWVNLTGSLVRDEAGRPDYFIAVVEEITARKRAESALRESEARFRIAAESASDLIYEWHVDTGRLDWFGDIDRALGCEPGEFPHTVAAWQGLLHPADRERVLDSVRRHLEDGTEFFEEYRIIDHNGHERYWTDRGRALRDADGIPYRFIGVTTDVTERKLAAQQVEEARDSAENASRAKDVFLAALSHELRTPLNPVLMLASELEASPQLNDQLREDFATIRKNIELEARLIDDLLDITRITRGKLHLKVEIADAHMLLHQSLEFLRADVEAKQIGISVDLAAPEHHVSCDAVRLQQVFWNVIKNAVKFTPRGGSISISTRLVNEAMLHIEISDTGIGIEPSEMPRIFNAFEQGREAASPRFGGLGLGLSITSVLVREHRGKIWAESAGRDKGSTFHIELPLVQRAAAEPEAPRAPQAAPRQTRHILLVEDHEPTRRLLTRLLEFRGHLVSPAETVSEARAKAAAESFDLVISDLGLPDGNGHELMADLNSRYGLSGIALSGYGMDEDVQRSMQVGFAVHLTKPVEMHDLDKAIDKICTHEAHRA